MAIYEFAEIAHGEWTILIRPDNDDTLAVRVDKASRGSKASLY